MIGVIDYYVRPAAGYRDTYEPGQFFYAPIPFVPSERPNRLKLDYFDPENPRNASFTLSRTDYSKVPYETDSSLRHLGLSRDEILVAIPVKKRPTILLSEHLTRPTDRVQRYSGYVVAPCYSLHDEAGNYKNWLTKEIILRAKAYQYKNIFYLPESRDHSLPEMFARFDRIQFIRTEHLEPIPVSLSDEATALIREWFYHFFGCPLFNPALEEYISTAADKLSQ